MEERSDDFAAVLEMERAAGHVLSLMVRAIRCSTAPLLTMERVVRCTHPCMPGFRECVHTITNPSVPSSCRTSFTRCHMLMYGCVDTHTRISFEVSREFWQDMPCDMEGVELAEVAVPLPMDIAVGASCQNSWLCGYWHGKLFVVQPEQ